LLRQAMGILPKRIRYALYRSFVRCDATPSARLVLKLAETREELNACFHLLHDAYVASGFMKPDPSGLRVTIYNALPTTTTLLASWDGKVVGTISLIRESELGFPLQKIFDISAIRSAGGQIVEVSALAVDPEFRATSGTILFPLMKFMYEYATRFFDTQHLVIAVNPRHIALYESLLFFRRMRKNPVSHYDFVNGAPAVGAHLDLLHAPELYREYYDHRPPVKNLFRYFTAQEMPNIVFPDKRFFTTNDPVMTPELIDYFFNKRTDTFKRLSVRERILLHAIYDLPAFQAVLPPLPDDTDRTELKRRRHQRFSVMCPGVFALEAGGRRGTAFAMQVIECSRTGFRARCDEPVPVPSEGFAAIDLGLTEHCRMKVRVLRHAHADDHIAMFRLVDTDLVWRKFVSALLMASTHGELGDATRFLEI
jgi:hypothetical protein